MRFWDSSEVRVPDRDKNGSPGKKAGLLALLIAVGFFLRKPLFSAASALLRVFRGRS
jgi:hypothetical protein